MVALLCDSLNQKQVAGIPTELRALMQLVVDGFGDPALFARLSSVRLCEPYAFSCSASCEVLHSAGPSEQAGKQDIERIGGKAQRDRAFRRS